MTQSATGIESATRGARVAAGYQADVQHELDFLFTREIEFRQETIYFIIVDRFFFDPGEIRKRPHYRR